VGGLSGCLLFTDPINEAPKVKIQRPSGEVVRGQSADFRVAELSDDRTPPSRLRLEWHEFEAQAEGCGAITAEAWRGLSPRLLDRDAPYTFWSRELEVVCVCVRATDLDGAAAHDCARIVPVNPPPEAAIKDVTGVASGALRPLCSNVRLSADGSRYQDGDTLAAHWTLEYAGSDPKGSTLRLSECAGAPGAEDSALSPSELQRCFAAKAPGVYTVRLTLAATPPGAGAASTLTSPPAVYVVKVDVDQPPYLERTEPDVHARWIVLSDTSAPEQTYYRRDFTVLSAADDCEPFPAPADAPTKGAQFVWSVLDPTRSPAWVYQTTTGNTFTVSQASYPNARPDDVIKVRVEVRDAAVERLYGSGISPCAESVDVCCHGGACTGVNDRVRWTTWTVQFLP
jgi:hypothetical protein